jgi:arylamine N-acetyltransferase
VISPALSESVLAKLGLPGKPTLDLAGLNQTYAAYSAGIPNDNIQKRIWLVGNRDRPVSGGEPTEFFETWLAHGTGGTCFPASGALCALLNAVGFDARRVLGAVLMDGIEHDGNHGTVLVRLDGTDYLVDAQLAAFSALPLVEGQPASTGRGIHDIRAVPVADGFDVLWYPGSNRESPLVMRPDLERGPVDHRAFVTQYALSAQRGRRRSPFNDALFIGRHFPHRIVIVGRSNRTEISADNAVSKREITLAERMRILVEELGISAEIAEMIPPDEEATA